jgi:Minor capsid.
MPSKVKIDFKPSKINEKLGVAASSATKMMMNEVHKDSNFFAPDLEGNLKRKVELVRRNGNWVLIWMSVYARRLYYGITFKFSTHKNPNASSFWFHKAKAKNLSKWMNFLKQSFKREYARL